MKKIIKNSSTDFTNFYFPPLLPMPDIPSCCHYGAYMVKRKFDVHTGVDLYAKEGSSVYAVEDGEIVAIRPFTGEEAGTPHWNNTMSIDIEGYTGTICYGEVDVAINLNKRRNWKVGDRVQASDHIANVKRVLQEFKGKATSMLHFAIHRPGWKNLYKDQLNDKMESFYDLQIDPTMLLIQLKHKADLIDIKRRSY